MVEKCNEINWTHGSYFEVEFLDKSHLDEQFIHTCVICFKVELGVIDIKIFWVYRLDDSIIECNVDIGLNAYIFIRIITQILEYEQGIKLPSLHKREARKKKSQKIHSTCCQSFTLSSTWNDWNIIDFSPVYIAHINAIKFFYHPGYTIKLLPVMIDISPQYFEDLPVWLKDYVTDEHHRCM